MIKQECAKSRIKQCLSENYGRNFEICRSILPRWLFKITVIDNKCIYTVLRFAINIKFYKSQHVIRACTA